MRLSLTNFLSIIFRATPPPKLLLLEKWHRAVTQQRLRRGLVLQCRRVSSVRRQLGSHETNLAALLTATRNIIEHLHQSAVSAARREMREGSDTGGRPGPESDRLGTNVDVVDGAGRAIYGAVLSPSMRSVVGTEAASSLFDDDGDGMDDGAVSFSAKGAAAETRFKVLREAGTCVLSLADRQPLRCSCCAACRVHESPGGRRQPDAPSDEQYCNGHCWHDVSSRSLSHVRQPG